MGDLPLEPLHMALQLQKGLQRKLGRNTKGAEGLFSCLHSICSDQLFVEELATLYPCLPVFANLRCGLWYAPEAQTCYFKSTDGHVSNWQFSTVRLNWHVAEACAAAGGALLVDATRNTYKSGFPDALTKTVPIWACVINRAVARVRAREQASSAAHLQISDHSQHGQQSCLARSGAQGGTEQVEKAQGKHNTEGLRTPSFTGWFPAKHAEEGSSTINTTLAAPQVKARAASSDSGSSTAPQLAPGCDLEQAAGRDVTRALSDEQLYRASEAAVAPVQSHPKTAGAAAGTTPAAAAGDEEGCSAWDCELHVPLWISSNERKQISARLEGWVDDLLAVHGPGVRQLAKVLRKPLRPLWLSPLSRIWVDQVAQPDDLPFCPIILISASCSKWSRERRIVSLTSAPHIDSTPNSADSLGEGSDSEQQGEGTLQPSTGKGLQQGGGCNHVNGEQQRVWQTCEYTYIPGAGDDEESWALGLTPALMVKHRQELLSALPSQLPQLVCTLVYQRLTAAPSAPVLVPHTVSQGMQQPLSTKAKVATPQHLLAPMGCVNGLELPGGSNNSAAATGTVKEVGPGLFAVGTTGLVVGDLSAGAPPQVWQHVDAVLNVGSKQHPGMTQTSTSTSSPASRSQATRSRRKYQSQQQHQRLAAAGTQPPLQEGVPCQCQGSSIEFKPMSCQEPERPQQLQQESRPPLQRSCCEHLFQQAACLDLGIPSPHGSLYTTNTHDSAPGAQLQPPAQQGPEGMQAAAAPEVKPSAGLPPGPLITVGSLSEMCRTCSSASLTSPSESAGSSALPSPVPQEIGACTCHSSSLAHLPQCTLHRSSSLSALQRRGLGGSGQQLWGRSNGGSNSGSGRLEGDVWRLSALAAMQAAATDERSTGAADGGGQLLGQQPSLQTRASGSVSVGSGRLPKMHLWRAPPPPPLDVAEQQSGMQGSANVSPAESFNFDFTHCVDVTPPTYISLPLEITPGELKAMRAELAAAQAASQQSSCLSTQVALEQLASGALSESATPEEREARQRRLEHLESQLLRRQCPICTSYLVSSASAAAQHHGAPACHLSLAHAPALPPQGWSNSTAPQTGSFSGATEQEFSHHLSSNGNSIAGSVHTTTRQRLRSGSPGLLSRALSLSPDQSEPGSHMSQVQRPQQGPSNPQGGDQGSAEQVGRYLWLPISSSKKDRFGLLRHLQPALQFVQHHVRAGRTVLIHDEEGLDQCVCIALAALLTNHKLGDVPTSRNGASVAGCDGQLHDANKSIAAGPHGDKQELRQMLAFLSSCYPKARPTRGMIKQLLNALVYKDCAHMEHVRSKH